MISWTFDPQAPIGLVVATGVVVFVLNVAVPLLNASIPKSASAEAEHVILPRAADVHISGASTIHSVAEVLRQDGGHE